MRNRDKLNGLYVITDPELLSSDYLLSGVQQALEGGASVVQYRNKTASEIDRLREAQNLNALCHDFNALFIVNDDASLCRRVRADGVHLGKQDGDIAEARQLLGAEYILGVTCHDDFAYAQTAHDLGVDYCAFGRFFPSRTKPNAPGCQMTLLDELDNKPYKKVAIGGITIDNARNILMHDIDMLAVIHGVFGQADIRNAAHSFSSLFNSSEFN